jgi:hypothetical protein
LLLPRLTATSGRGRDRVADRNEQEEQDEDDQENDRPASISSEYTVHVATLLLDDLFVVVYMVHKMHLTDERERLLSNVRENWAYRLTDTDRHNLLQ